MAEVSIVYATHRPAPRFDWFADGLAGQLGDDAPEVIVVDGRYSDKRALELAEIVGERFPLVHVPPKPTPWNGPHRVTGADYFAAASARNTGIVHTTAPYVAFVDDCSILGPGWWSEVRNAAQHGFVVAGAYRKAEEMVVENGALVHSRDPAEGRDIRDVRWELGDDRGLTQVAGGQLYGCSFGAPRDLLVHVNGLDELTDPVGQGDCQLGVRLEWTGERILYSRRMLTIESMDQYRQPNVARLYRSLDPDVYMRRLAELGVTERAMPDRWTNSTMIFDLLHGSRETRSVGNGFDLASLKPRTLEATATRFPQDYWFDGTPLASL